MSAPTGGTFTFDVIWKGKNGVSDPVAWNASAAEAHAAYVQAHERADAVSQMPPLIYKELE